MNLVVLTKRILSRLTVIPQYCHRCGRREDIVWYVRDKIWDRLPYPWGKKVGYGVLCLECFSELVDYDVQIDDFLVWACGKKGKVRTNDYSCIRP